ncbi:hypothetical protein AAE478_009098 [Parahypoxylon ruwenzoriense]
MPPRESKEPWQYSTNPHTVRSRTRKDRLTEGQKVAGQAKAADVKALNRAWKLEARTEEFKTASKEDRRMILANVEGRVQKRRRANGIDADTKVKHFMDEWEKKQQGKEPHETNTSTPISDSPSESSTASTPAAAPAPVLSTTATDASSDVSHATTDNYGSVLSYQQYATLGQAGNVIDGHSASISSAFQSDREVHLQPPFSQIPQQPPIPLLRDHDPTAVTTVNVNLWNLLELTQSELQALKNQVNWLTDELFATRSTMAALEARVTEMNNHRAINLGAGADAGATSYPRVTKPFH